MAKKPKAPEKEENETDDDFAKRVAAFEKENPPDEPDEDEEETENEPPVDPEDKPEKTLEAIEKWKTELAANLQTLETKLAGADQTTPHFQALSVELKGLREEMRTANNAFSATLQALSEKMDARNEPTPAEPKPMETPPTPERKNKRDWI